MASKNPSKQTTRPTSKRPGTSGTKPGKAPKGPAGSEAAGFVVDDGLNVVEFLGQTAPFLSIAPGGASLSVRKILRPDLQPEVVKSLDLAMKKTSSGETVLRRKGPKIWIEGRPRRVDIEVSPVTRPRLKRPHWRILLRRREAAARPRPGSPGRLSGARQVDLGVRIEQPRRDVRSLLENEMERHAALLAELEATQGDVESTRARLQEAYGELEAISAELVATLEERNEFEQKLIRSEAASRELLETAAQGVIAVDARERIVRVNHLACTMFGYSRKELLQQTLGALIPKGLGRVHSRHMAAFLREPSRRTMGAGRDLLGRRKDGTLFPVEIGLSSVELEDGPLGVAFISDITERKRAETEIMDQREQLRQLNMRLITASEETNRRWARELHDDYSQRLVAVAMKAWELSKEGPDGGEIRSLGDEVRSLAQDIHQLSRQMHPTILHDLGLSTALRQELSALGRDCALETSFRSSSIPERLPDEISLAFYRIAQEALRNVRKHAGAQRVWIEVEGADDELRMLVADEGHGFDPGRTARRGGVGMVSMEERARAVGGAFSIASTPGEGTRVSVRAPLKRR